MVIVEPVGMAGITYSLGNELTVGRAPGCGISIDDTFVSTLHARIHRVGDHWVVEDLDSTNGTWLNDQRVAESTVMHMGDRLRFGAALLELQ